jgi:hypothetical protein
VVIAIVVIVAILGLVAYLGYPPFCEGLVCGPIPYPAIEGASARVLQTGESNCQITETVAVCPVFINGGNSGEVDLNVANKDVGSGNDGSRAVFLVYSSEPSYINFTSIPNCAYESAPSYEAPSCPVSGNSAETFQFSFTVAQGYGNSSQREFASITIVMDKTCCWP